MLQTLLHILFIANGGNTVKKIMLTGVCFCLCACSSNVLEGTGTHTNAKGEVTTVQLKMDGETIKEVEIDETTSDTTKKKLGAEYNMRQASTIGKEWNEQVQFLEQYIQKNGIDKLQLNDEGKATNEDVLTGCTIAIDGFLEAIQNAQETMK